MTGLGAGGLPMLSQWRREQDSGLSWFGSQSERISTGSSLDQELPYGYWCKALIWAPVELYFYLSDSACAPSGAQGKRFLLQLGYCRCGAFLSGLLVKKYFMV